MSLHCDYIVLTLYLPRDALFKIDETSAARAPSCCVCDRGVNSNLVLLVLLLVAELSRPRNALMRED